MDRNRVPQPPIVPRESWLGRAQKLSAGEETDQALRPRQCRAAQAADVKVREDYLVEVLASIVAEDCSRVRGNSSSIISCSIRAWEKGCPGCTNYANAIVDLRC